jgi:hypothetical protein
MSQAHYVRCQQTSEHAPFGPELPPAVAAIRSPRGIDWRLCLECLNGVLDRADDRPEFEPTALSWTWGPGERVCPLHHWPDVVCGDWSAEHAAMLRAMWPAASGRTLGEPRKPDHLRSLLRG